MAGKKPKSPAKKIEKPVSASRIAAATQAVLQQVSNRQLRKKKKKKTGVR
jgi:hypothetical protein